MTDTKHESNNPASLSNDAQIASMNRHAALVDAQARGGHTSGPWRADSYYGTTDRPEVIGNSRSVAVIQQVSENYQDERTGIPKYRLVTNGEVWANARLIAAAPEMLEALMDIHPTIRDDSLRCRVGNIIMKAIEG